jgi:predicted transcriptional regulator
MDDNVLRYTVEIVSAQLRGTSVAAGAVPDLVRAVYKTLSTVTLDAQAPVKVEPAVPIKSSVFLDHLVCLECGGQFKTLRRHLNAEHGLTPETYRSKFGLPVTYPVIAPDYAKTRSELAKVVGVGTGPRGNRKKARSK